MSYSKPKHPGFVHWLRTTGQITNGEYLTLNDEWQKAKRKNTDHKVFTTGPITWGQFVARKYPRKVLAYQAYLRLTGAAPTFKKD